MDNTKYSPEDILHAFAKVVDECLKQTAGIEEHIYEIHEGMDEYVWSVCDDISELLSSSCLEGMDELGFFEAASVSRIATSACVSASVKDFTVSDRDMLKLRDIVSKCVNFSVLGKVDGTMTVSFVIPEVFRIII